MTQRVLLALLAASAALVGFWAQLAPAGFYQSFPGLGMHWVRGLGPYNEHLTRDVGGLYLALLVLSVGALARSSDTYLVRLTGAAWAIFSVGHLVFHVAHLSMLGTRDRILELVSLAGTLLFALALLLSPHRGGSR